MAAPQAIGLRHLALNVTDVARAEAFYVGLLGFTVEWRPDADNLYLRLGADNLAIHRYVAADKDDEDAFRRRRGQHLAHLGIAVPSAEDVDAWAAHLRAHVKMLAEPRTHRDGARSFYCEDPDGNAVQICTTPRLATQLQENASLRNLEEVAPLRRFLLLFLVAAAGCEDDPYCAQPPAAARDSSAPNIRMLEYTPNAGFVNETNKVNGMVLYSDSDKDVSQGVIEFSDPNKMLVFRTEPIPVQGVGGIMGTATFNIELAPHEVPTTGIYRFCVWVVDLTARESNHLGGAVRIATRAPYGPDNP